MENDTKTPTSIKQEMKNFNIIIKQEISYAYYVIPFSKPYIKKLDKILSKPTKKKHMQNTYKCCQQPYTTQHQQLWHQYHITHPGLHQLHLATTNSSTK